MTRYGFAINTQQCTGCHTCAVACKYANNLPSEVWYLKVHTQGGETMDSPEGIYPDCKLSYRPVSCMHCDSPACMEVCPTGSVTKRDDGIVVTNPETCIGCQSCIYACPYESVRTLLSSDLEYSVDIELGTIDAPNHKGSTVEKCNMCYQRLDRGQAPVCVESCPTWCRIFGDLDDPDSGISKALKNHEYELLEEGSEISPNIYYLK